MSLKTHLRLFLSLIVLCCSGLSESGLASAADNAEAAVVTLMRTPHAGIQPQVAVDSRGTVHLIYFKGDPAAGDIFYVCREQGAADFSSPVRVNGQPNSAVALGTIRGAQLAVAPTGRVHVVWNGSKQAQPRGADPQHGTPMLYARLDDSGRAFEAQRNLIHTAYGLDGGGSVAADQQGNVYAVWHANPAADGESNRRVYMATSRDEGRSFAAEVPISESGTGTCGCCGMKAMVDTDGRLMVMYRSATDLVQRDMYLLTSDDGGRSFHSQIVDPWEVARCPMSSAAMAESPRGTLTLWQTAGRVHLGCVDDVTGTVADRLNFGAGEAAHPAVAVGDTGDAIVVWDEGTGWNRGGAVAWQLLAADGTLAAAPDRRDGVPVWSMPAVFTNAEGGFTIMY